MRGYPLPKISDDYKATVASFARTEVDEHTLRNFAENFPPHYQDRLMQLAEDYLLISTNWEQPIEESVIDGIKVVAATAKCIACAIYGPVKAKDDFYNLRGSYPVQNWLTTTMNNNEQFHWANESDRGEMDRAITTTLVRLLIWDCRMRGFNG